MKPCSYCGRENGPEATVCRECGTPFPVETTPEPAEPAIRIPPVIGPRTVVLSNDLRFLSWLHEFAFGDALCRCEWRPEGLFLRTRRGELLTPLSEISAFWGAETRNCFTYYEIQVKNKELPEWRFVFASAYLPGLGLGMGVVDRLKRAILMANPEASVIPLPVDPGLLEQFIRKWVP